MKNYGFIYFPNGCNHCGSPVEFVDSSIIYGKSYGMIYKCTKCDSYVGSHKPDYMYNQPLGRLANKIERELKKEAHSLFDPLWKTGKIDTLMPDIIKTNSRKKAYIWLSKKLNISLDSCHIGHFTENTLREVIEILKKT
ncbi:MAG TPA: zinc-finger-containing protein [Candidatus Mcinerneyibacterium sp.]|nr:zinc-finger-containing protein [Candidatus Mcinerneyibacterium sp.]